MLLAMKIKVAITAAALASPVALTMAPVASGDHRSGDTAITEIAAGPFSIGSPATFHATASRPKPRCARRDCQPASRS